MPVATTGSTRTPDAHTINVVHDLSLMPVLYMFCTPQEVNVFVSNTPPGL